MIRTDNFSHFFLDMRFSKSIIHFNETRSGLRGRDPSALKPTFEAKRSCCVRPLKGG